MRALKMSIVSSHWKLTMTIQRSWSSSNYRGSCQRTQHQPFYGHLAQFSSVAQSCLTLCNPMDCSTPGLPVHHQLPECLKQIGKVKSSISGCLMSWPKKKKKCHFEGSSFLILCNNNKPFLDQIMTWEEKEILRDNQLSGWTEMQLQSTSQSQTCTKKRVLVIVWWSAASLIHYNFLNSRETITSDKYAQQIN